MRFLKDILKGYHSSILINWTELAASGEKHIRLLAIALSVSDLSISQYSMVRMERGRGKESSTLYN